MFRRPAALPTILAVLGLAVAALPASALAVQSKAFEGRKLYTSYCLVCHGIMADGKGPLARTLKVKPADLTSTQARARSDQELFQTIESGKRHAEVAEGMPRWGAVLPGPSIQQLVAYIRFLQQSRYPLLGDPDVGRSIYGLYCTSCHGASGRGDGVMTRILLIKPADHTKAEAIDRISNEELLRIVRDGEKSMPGWKGVLSDEEIRAVASYIRFLAH